MPSFDTLLAFLGLSIALTLAPGPDNLMVLGQALAQGWRAGLAIALGCALGCLTHLTWTVLGVAALLAASPRAFFALRVAGAAWLLGLAVQALRGSRPVRAGDAAAVPWRRSLRRGFVANALNPKVALFFLAFLPQFVDPARSDTARQMIVLGLVFSAQTVVVFGGIALASGALGHALARHPALGPWLDRLCGLIFAGIALRLLAEPSAGA